MSITVPDLPPEQWRVARPEVVQVDQVGTCECSPGCGAPAQVLVVWPSAAGPAQITTCLAHVTAAVGTALDDSREDTQVAVSLLICRAAENAA